MDDVRQRVAMQHRLTLIKILRKILQKRGKALIALYRLASSSTSIFKAYLNLFNPPLVVDRSCVRLHEGKRADLMSIGIREKLDTSVDLPRSCPVRTTM